METIKRATARICPLKYLLTGTYIVQDGWKPNYVAVGKDHITRVNIIGLVVQKISANTFYIDDGTGSIQVIDFSQSPNTAELSIGDPVLVIGRPRKQEENLFIASEVVATKQLRDQPELLVMRQQELQNYTAPPVITQPVTKQPEPPSAEILTGDDVVDFIRKKDGGAGCLVEDVVEYFGKDAEDVVHTLLSMGEIYEIRPGSVKVLE